MEQQTTDEKVKLAIEQYNKKAKFDDRITKDSYHAQFFRSGYIYGMVRANEEGCTWGLEQGKKEITQLKEQLSTLQSEVDKWKNAYTLTSNDRKKRILEHNTWIKRTHEEFTELKQRNATLLKALQDIIGSKSPNNYVQFFTFGELGRQAIKAIEQNTIK